MFTVYIDSGTTNTRAYLLNDDKVVDVVRNAVGSRDSSINGNNQVLLDEIVNLYRSLLVRQKLIDADIRKIFASGMVTSPFGIKEVAHLTIPVSLKSLHQKIYQCYEPKLLNRNIGLIRGVKTIPENFQVNCQNVIEVNNMRGEEIEVFGVLSMLPQDGGRRSAVFLPGSHTHIVYVEDNEICDVFSTFSGELFRAVATSTILSSSICLTLDTLDEEMIRLGFRALREYGINRALYLVNTMKIFSQYSNQEKTSFLEGVIAGGVILAFAKHCIPKWTELNQIIVAADFPITKLYEILLDEMKLKLPVRTLESDVGKSFAVRGYIELLKMEETT
jgi:2-dehydro-3-deoxygalactonokinase